MREMIPVMSLYGRRRAARALAAAGALTFALSGNGPATVSDSAPPTAQTPATPQTAPGVPTAVPPAGPAAPGPAAAGPAAPGIFALPGTLPAPEASAGPANCLASGDGYLRARVAGALETRVDWRNSGLRCQGEARDAPPGVRLSFQRPGGKPDLLFVFGLTGVREGRPAHEVATNLTIIVQGTDRIYGTLGDSRCTVDSLAQRRLGGKNYRLEARGFCTQPAHAVRGEGVVLVSTFEFAGIVNYEGSQDAAESARANP
jgi:hypothetical protein